VTNQVGQQLAVNKMLKPQLSPVVGVDRSSHPNMGVSSEYLVSASRKFPTRQGRQPPDYRNQLEAAKWLDFNNGENVH
jgi:hypothetical protein